MAGPQLLKLLILVRDAGQPHGVGQRGGRQRRRGRGLGGGGPPRRGGGQGEHALRRWGKRVQRGLDDGLDLVELLLGDEDLLLRRVEGVTNPGAQAVDAPGEAVVHRRQLVDQQRKDG